MVSPWKTKFILGITGTIGGGKTTASRIFESLGCQRLSSDEIARSFSEPISPILSEWVELFGIRILDNEGKLDRRKIAEVVFSDPAQTKRLNDFLHPKVRKEFLKRLDQFPEPFVLAWEVPLLFETDAHTLCQGTLTVGLPEAESWKRVQTRGGMSEKDFWTRTRSQKSWDEKKSLSDFVIWNDTTQEELENNCRNLLSEIWQAKVI